LKLKFKSIVFIIIGILLLLPVFIYGGKAFVNFTAVIANLSKEISFIIDIAKFSYKEFFYSSGIMKYVAKLFIGVVGFRFFIGLFFDVYRFASISLVKDKQDRRKINNFVNKQRYKLKKKDSLPSNNKRVSTDMGGFYW